jgi:uncharacterized Rossmann fold enzyme
MTIWIDELIERIEKQDTDIDEMKTIYEEIKRRLKLQEARDAKIRDLLKPCLESADEYYVKPRLSKALLLLEGSK